MEIPPYYINKDAYLSRQYESEESQRLSNAITDKLNQLEWMKEHSFDEWLEYTSKLTGTNPNTKSYDKQMDRELLETHLGF